MLKTSLIRWWWWWLNWCVVVGKNCVRSCILYSIRWSHSNASWSIGCVTVVVRGPERSGKLCCLLNLNLELTRIKIFFIPHAFDETRCSYNIFFRSAALYTSKKIHCASQHYGTDINYSAPRSTFALFAYRIHQRSARTTTVAPKNKIHKKTHTYHYTQPARKPISCTSHTLSTISSNACEIAHMCWGRGSHPAWDILYQQKANIKRHVNHKRAYLSILNARTRASSDDKKIFSSNNVFFFLSICFILWTRPGLKMRLLTHLYDASVCECGMDDDVRHRRRIYGALINMQIHIRFVCVFFLACVPRDDFFFTGCIVVVYTSSPYL